MRKHKIYVPQLQKVFPAYIQAIKYFVFLINLMEEILLFFI
jgi:hypothetical protein